MINHKENCTHAQTPKARKACRKAAKAQATKVVTVLIGTIGNGKAVHMIERHGEFARCGKGTPATIHQGASEAPISAVTCKSCVNKFGHSHG